MNARKVTIYDPRYRELIASLVAYRKENGITQEQIAQKMEITRQNVSKVEIYTRRLDVLELNDWLDALGVKLDLVKTIKKSL